MIILKELHGSYNQSSLSKLQNLPFSPDYVDYLGVFRKTEG